MNEQEKKLVEGITSTNLGFDNSSALQIRLDCKDLLEQIEFFLRGLEPNTYWDDKTNQWQQRLIPMGEAKANKRGIQALLNYCRALINPQVVQGNYKEDRYIDFIIEKRIEIARMLFVNFYDWELKYDDAIAEITDFIMNMVEPFLSRTIDNEERLSYAQTIRTNETNTLASRGGFNLFGGGNREQ